MDMEKRLRISKGLKRLAGNLGPNARFDDWSTYLIYALIWALAAALSGYALLSLVQNLVSPWDAIMGDPAYAASADAAVIAHPVVFLPGAVLAFELAFTFGAGSSVYVVFLMMRGLVREALSLAARAIDPSKAEGGGCDF